ncbi:EscJ/YscJ/HrcJ family type III secretion inner membrane ring protein [Yersinia nurmii]|uniref:Lipoprotein n=1 Tax=Yersinia nurmii TaxID=685706 RepID=A0AAW7K223_9GAMM|nr:EscJ/YscJ/HrcJ family type III secretion inner membrane ring protein [Yersinia nurmii]MDN0086159.1 EscJ/YscJ/HrcJ family type III secretion inner membrane ring protein [Yersinia nurmii]CND83004.1 type III secretion system apparatus lipoprotein [Yersinia nurmii]
MLKFKIFVPLLLLLLVGCKEQELLKKLDQTQANEIIALLLRNNIDASKKEITKEGYVVSVNKIDFAAAVDLMNTYDLPTRPRIEIAEMFPSDSLISSPRAEKARLYSGIEQRLEQSLQTLQGVVSARVHVSYDLSSSEGQKKTIPVHLSALVKYDAENIDATVMISDVKRFLKNSFDDVAYNDISVVLSKIPQMQHQAPFTVKKGLGGTLWFMIAAVILFIFSSIAMYLYRKKRTEIRPAAESE